MAVALITGGSRGIGAATAVRLAQDGHDIAIAYRSNAEAAQRIAADVQGLGPRAATFAADMSEVEAPGALVSAVERELGPAEILIANAGINDPLEQDPRQIDAAVWDRVMAINLRAPFLLVGAAIGGMLDRGFGRIVLLSSVAAYTGGIVGPHYAASKAGLHGLAHSLSQFASGHGVTVNVVAPALIATDMMPTDERALDELAGRIPVGRLGRPEEVADLIAAIVSNPYLTNQSILVDGGIRPS
ncbi:MAG TPA: SDR family NAD(P)-dependent oxidoreductase [Solirubrobacteraceae bacterium]|nr:SDR family NAD(P)-dependent oxidoreductase [Solirubrobacteraceae bacterium]